MRLSKNVEAFRPSPIRAMLRVVANPNIISFAGGMPGEDLFPIDDVREMVQVVPRKMMEIGLQYGTTDGLGLLIEEIKKVSEAQGFDMTKNKVIITTGSTQVMNIVAKLMLDPNDIMLTEDPVFVGSLGAFCSYNAQVIGVPLDNEGIVIEELERALKLHPKFIYITPTFHNPAGLTYSEKRRQEFIEMMAKYPDTMVLEDDAYGRLYFDEETAKLIKPMKAYAPNEQQFIYCSSFSKIFGPGLRIGWMIVPNELYDVAEIAKQSMDACTPVFSQILAYEFIRTGRMDKYVVYLRDTYKLRRDAMVNAIRKYCPAEATFVEPKGGFFVWLRLPDGVDTDALFDECSKNGVVFVKGSAFTPDGRDNRHIRISFCNVNEEIIEKGVKILGDAMHSLMKK